MNGKPASEEAARNAAVPVRSNPEMLRVRVTLEGSTPPIWRVLDLDSSLPLDAVHHVLQCAFGWRQSHLHFFTDRDPARQGAGWPASEARRWGPRMLFEDDEDSDRDLSETDWTLGQILAADGGPLFYEYDLGDGWTHRLEIVSVLPGSAGAPPARLIGGAMRAPLEDSGGIGGYRRLLAALADPGNDEHQALTAWVAAACGPWQAFDPAKLDITAVNEEFADLFLPSDGFLQSPRGAGRDPAASRELTARVHPGLRTEFRSYVAAALDGPSGVDPEHAQSMVAPYLWLIRRIGPDGLGLTAAGWLPPAVVRAAMDDLGWSKDWPVQVNREDSAPPVRSLRESAQRLGLIRKLKGRLVLGAAARRLLEDPPGLWMFLAQATAHRYRHDSQRDAVLLLLLEIAAGNRTDWNEYIETVAFGLGALGWCSTDGFSPASDSVEELLGEHRGVFLRLGVFEDGPGPWLSAAVTAQGRAFARAVLLA